MAGELQRALDFIEAAEVAQSMGELQLKLASTLQQFGVPHFTVGAMLKESQAPSGVFQSPNALATITQSHARGCPGSYCRVERRDRARRAKLGRVSSVGKD